MARTFSFVNTGGLKVDGETGKCGSCVPGRDNMCSLWCFRVHARIKQQ